MNLIKDKKIHILYLVSRLRRVGPVFQLYNIIKNLDRDRFDPQIITLSPEGENSLIDRFRDIDVECNSVGLPSTLGMILGAKKIRKLLQNNPADLIQASDYRSILLCASNFARLPRVVTCRQAFDYTHYSLEGTLDPISARVMVKTFEMACRRCERVVGVSDFVRHSARNELAARMAVIHNGVDQDLFRAVDKEKKTALRSKLNLPHDKHILISVGFLSKRKDPVTVIKAFLKSKVGQTAVLVLLGDGALRDACLRLVGANNNVRIVGFVKNVRDYLGAADTFVSASLAEGCPNAVMEALACGLTVILSDIPPHREILTFNKTAGELFKPKNIKAIARTFSEIDNISYSSRSQAAFSIISNHLNAKIMSSKYQILYQQLYDKYHQAT